MSTDVPSKPSQWLTLHRAGLVGLGLSLGLHLILLTVLALTRLGADPIPGAGIVAPGPVEMALVLETSLHEPAPGAGTAALSPGVEETPGNADLVPMPIIESVGGSGLPDAGDLGGSGSALGGAGSGTGIGIGSGSGGAGGGGTSFFGVEAQGQRIAFVVDVSGSMEQFGKIEYLRVQLRRAIDAMVDGSQFMVVCFSSDKQPLMGREGWTDVTASSKRQALGAIDALRADGGTEPMSSFRVVLGARPRADAVYFMTDGLFAPSIPDQVLALDPPRGESRARVPIHCITFMDRSSEAGMRRIAEMTGGTYRHVEAPRP